MRSKVSDEIAEEKSLLRPRSNWSGMDVYQRVHLLSIPNEKNATNILFLQHPAN